MVPLDSGTNALTQAHSVVEITQLYRQAIEAEVEWVYFVKKSVDVDAEASGAQFVRWDNRVRVEFGTTEGKSSKSIEAILVLRFAAHRG
ncbi:MAG TPA: hypothetical protein V6C65_30920, partial [Allocoleopsis sp.]